MLENNYGTLTETINALRREGYTDDLNVRQDCIECKKDEYRLSPNQFVVDKVYRFEGPTDPADEAILYAISSTTNGRKGLLVNAYGVYSDPMTNELVEKLRIAEH